MLPSRQRASLLAVAVAASLAALGCGSSGRSLPARAGGLLDELSAARRSPREDYATGLERAGLGATALGAAWQEAAANALATASAVPLPHREVGVFDPARPAAVAWQVELRRGLALVVDTSLASDRPARLFVDLLRWDGAAWRLVAGSDDGTLRHPAGSDGPHLLRLQPELLRGGRWALTLRLDGALVHPVPDAQGRPLIGRFGDPRDGGARRHEGVDLPAPRGTTVVAAASGFVTEVGNNARGGKVVWLTDEQGRTHYYAHLDEQLTRAGDRVRQGQPIGRVGNTGNAAATAPHLHFGLFFGSAAVDPLPFLAAAKMPPPPVAPPELLGAWGRVRTAGSRLRAAPSTAAAIRGELPRRAALAIEGGSGEWLRVTAPGHGAGWVHASLVEAAAAPLFRARPREPYLLERPAAGASAIAALATGEIGVLATAPGWLLVADGGRTGWVAEAAAAAGVGSASGQGQP